MAMSPGLRRLLLTAHVTFSVGWLGAVAGFLALAIAGLTSTDGDKVRAVYVATELITWLVIVPASLGAFLSGVVQSLGTPWGLFRHYWVLIKLIITVVATLLLVLHTRPIGMVADAARRGPLAGPDVTALQVQLVVDAALALVALVVTTTLAVYKPRGTIRRVA
jgi:hypothetical protein